MNRVPFSNSHNQSSPPNYPIGRMALNGPLQYKNLTQKRNSGHSNIREEKYMKFRRWQSEEYFVQIAEEVVKLGEKQYGQESKQLSGRVKVSDRWAVYNWVIEFQNLMHMARADQHYLMDTNNTHQQRNTSINMLQLPQQYMDKLDSIRFNIQQIKLNKCLGFLLRQLSTVEFYALQFMVKLMKINEFFKNMKAFSEAVGKFEKEFSCFNGGSNSSRIGMNDSDNRDRNSKNSETSNANNHKSNNNNNHNPSNPNQSNPSNPNHNPPPPPPQTNQYQNIFYTKNLPQLNSIKSCIMSIIQNYQLSLLLSQTNTQWYEIQICIKLVRQEIYRQQIELVQKQQQFQFLIVNSGIDQTLGRISQMRVKYSNNSYKNNSSNNKHLLRKYNNPSNSIIRVGQLIKQLDHIVDAATQIVQQNSIYKQRQLQKNKMKITKCIDEINSDNSIVESILIQQEERTKKLLPHTDMYINTLGFSKSLSVSNNNSSSNSSGNSGSNNLYDDTLMMREENNKHKANYQYNSYNNNSNNSNNNNNSNNFINTTNHINTNDQKTQKNLLQMLQDQKTIRQNFTLLTINEVKKQKKIKKMSRKRQLYKFQCLNGKIVLSEQNTHIHRQKNTHIHRQKKKQMLFRRECQDDQNLNQNNDDKSSPHYIRNKYKQKRLQQLQERKRRYKQHSTKHDSIQQEHKNQPNQLNQLNYQQNQQQDIINELSPEYKFKENEKFTLSDHKHRNNTPKIVKKHCQQQQNDNNNLSPPQQQQQQQQKQQQPYQENNIFTTPIKDKSILEFVKMPPVIDFQQQQQQQQQDHHHLNFNNINNNNNNIKVHQQYNHRHITNQLINNQPLNKASKLIQQEHSFFNKKDQHSNIKSLSNDKTINFKQSYKLANNRFAPLSRANTSINRYNPKMSFIRKHKTPSSSRHLRPSLQPTALQMTYFKKLHQPRFDAKYVNSYQDDQYLVDDTPPKYKKTAKVTHQ